MSAIIPGLIGIAVVRTLGMAVVNKLAPEPESQSEYMKRRMQEIDDKLGNMNSEDNEEIVEVKRVRPVEVKRYDVISEEDRPSVAAGCLPCARSHFSTASAGLHEALRFARDPKGPGIMHPEVITRLQTVEEELNILERHDWTPAKIKNSPPEDRAIIGNMLPRLREVRQDVTAISSVEDLEIAAARMQELSIELRMKLLKKNGVNTDRLVELAKEVESGETSVEDAVREVREEVIKGGNS